jgi:hypothetical protein
VDYFKSLLVWIAYHLVSIADNMASQNPEDWEFSLAHSLDDPIQLCQPLIFRRRVRDEAENSESCVQPRSDLDLQQLPLTSLKSLQLDARALVIILEAQAMLVGGHRVMFEGCFQNTNEGHMVSRLSDEIGHRLWLQGPLNHLGGERRATYIVAVLRHILEFLHV